MKIGIDLHGVIDDDPRWFMAFISLLIVETGRWREPVNTVCIISGPPKEDILKELEKHGFLPGSGLSEVYSVVDHLKEKEDVEMWQDERGRWWTHDEEWWKAKAEICEKHNIDILIDDKKEWMPHFKNIKTKFLLYGGQNENRP